MGAAARDAGIASLLLWFEDCFGLSAGLSSLTKPRKSWSLIGFFHLCACWRDQFPYLAGCRCPSAGMMQGLGQWLKQHGAFWSQCKFISINEAGLNQLRSQSLQEVYTGADLYFIQPYFGVRMFRGSFKVKLFTRTVSLHIKCPAVGYSACKVPEFDKF